MSGRHLILPLALALLAAACTVGTSGAPGGARAVESTVAVATAPPSTTIAATTTTPPRNVSVGMVEIPPGGAPIFSDSGATSAEYIVAEGLLLGFDTRREGFLEVRTPCDQTMWVREGDVAVTAQARGAGPPGNADLAKATIVIDPGHGERDWGGVGPTGLAEKDVNLDISDRLRDLLLSPHDIDWTRRRVADGTSVPAVATVWLTRDASGPNEGDYELSLAYRSHIANTAGADVFVSIHNNTVPTADTTGPGSEVFYAWSVDGSDRLASLIYDEIIGSFSEFEADWKGGLTLGARARIDPETDTDYYGILRRANMPAAIVEGAYISEPSEEALLRSPGFRQAYAEAVYRGIVRFLTTSEFGAEINDPELFTADAGTVDTSSCEVPEQP